MFSVRIFLLQLHSHVPARLLADDQTVDSSVTMEMSRRRAPYQKPHATAEQTAAATGAPKKKTLPDQTERSRLTGAAAANHRASSRN